MQTCNQVSIDSAVMVSSIFPCEWIGKWMSELFITANRRFPIVFFCGRLKIGTDIFLSQWHQCKVELALRALIC